MLNLGNGWNPLPKFVIVQPLTSTMGASRSKSGSSRVYRLLFCVIDFPAKDLVVVNTANNLRLSIKSPVTTQMP